MHAFLVHQLPDIPDSPDTLKILPNPSIGIEEVRQIQKFLSRKPIRDGKNTVIVTQAHLLTIPAQNALLKTLEEPPGNSLVYLVTPQPDSLLPAILSRVQITDLPNPPGHPDLSISLALFSKLQKAGVGERLKILEEQEFTRETALKFLDELEHIIHAELRQLRVVPRTSVASRGATLSDLIHQTHTYLKANCNLKLCLSHLAINLSHTVK